MEAIWLTKAQINIQDAFLNQVRKDKILVTIYLMNGFQLKGLIKGFDNFTIVLVDIEGRQQIVYKHAVSTIVPVSPVSFTGMESI